MKVVIHMIFRLLTVVLMILFCSPGCAEQKGRTFRDDYTILRPYVVKPVLTGEEKSAQSGHGPETITENGAG